MCSVHARRFLSNRCLIVFSLLLCLFIPMLFLILCLGVHQGYPEDVRRQQAEPRDLLRAPLLDRAAAGALHRRAPRPHPAAAAQGAHVGHEYARAQLRGHPPRGVCARIQHAAARLDPRPAPVSRQLAHPRLGCRRAPVGCVSAARHRPLPLLVRRVDRARDRGQRRTGHRALPRVPAPGHQHGA